MSASDLGESVLVSETGLGRLQLVVLTPNAAFLADEPQSVGGLGSGPTPYDLPSGALGSCTAMTLRLYAERQGWPVGRIQVKVVHRRASVEARDLFERTICIAGPLDETQRTRLLEIAERCPVHRTLERGSEVRTTLSPLDPQDAPSAADGSTHMEHMEQAA
jgi:putative redox protein